MSTLPDKSAAPAGMTTSGGFTPAVKGPFHLYVLTGYGEIPTDWMRACFRLFKDEGVCIRKLVLLKNSHPEHFGMIELHFTLPQSSEDFLAPLESHLATLVWQDRKLTKTL